MTKQEVEARIAAAVAKQVEAIVAEQQKQFAATLEAVMKNAVGGMDKTNASLAKERKAVEKELDAVKALRAKAERGGEKMATEAYETHREQYEEACRTALLRDLTRMHLEIGKSNRDIAVWLDVPQDFVENIRQVMKRAEKFNSGKPKRTLLEGNPKVHLTGGGRTGDVIFESRETTFTTWWEFGRGNTLLIVDIPAKERWEAHTQLPLAKRMDVLNFIGEHIVIHETGGAGSFIIGDNVLMVYSGK
ncbi:MAG: hypothetical protein AAB316_00410 [Bacteroidota bacterium]